MYAAGSESGLEGWTILCPQTRYLKKDTLLIIGKAVMPILWGQILALNLLESKVKQSRLVKGEVRKSVNIHQFESNIK